MTMGQLHWSAHVHTSPVTQKRTESVPRAKLKLASPLAKASVCCGTHSDRIRYRHIRHTSVERHHFVWSGWVKVARRFTSSTKAAPSAAAPDCPERIVRALESPRRGAVAQGRDLTCGWEADQIEPHWAAWRCLAPCRHLAYHRPREVSPLTGRNLPFCFGAKLSDSGIRPAIASNSKAPTHFILLDRSGATSPIIKLRDNKVGKVGEVILKASSEGRPSIPKMELAKLLDIKDVSQLNRVLDNERLGKVLEREGIQINRKRKEVQIYGSCVPSPAEGEFDEGMIYDFFQEGSMEEVD